MSVAGDGLTEQERDKIVYPSDRKRLDEMAGDRGDEEIEEYGDAEMDGEDDGETGETNYNNKGDTAEGCEDFTEESTSTVDFKVLTPARLDSEMTEMITEVNDILEVRPGIGRILLQKFNWRLESLLEKFYDSPNPTAFFNSVQMELHHQEFNSIEAECEICFETTEIMGLACEHRFCIGCWTTYLTGKVEEKADAVIRCMAPNCMFQFEEEMVTSFLVDPNVLSCYRELLVKNYVETNRLIKWCPGVNCNNALRVTHSSVRHVECTCGASFCFFCGDDSHEPVQCRLLKIWIKRDDTTSIDWILKNTKDCPQCKIHIEKNEGCNHMTCKNCSHEFCWLCMGNWRGHSNCNRFAQAADANREKLADDIQRYSFFNSRYIGHRQSLDLETNLREKVEAKMKELQELSGFLKGEVVFLRKAVDALSKCRRTLMYSYVFAYFLEKNMDYLIFEENQNNLQTETEKLSDILENGLDFDDLQTLRRKVQNLYEYVDSRRQVLLEHCSEGEEKGNWAYNQ